MKTDKLSYIVKSESKDKKEVKRIDLRLDYTPEDQSTARSCGTCVQDDYATGKINARAYMKRMFGIWADILKDKGVDVGGSR